MASACVQVAYIDTEGTFRAEKIRAIAARFDLDADAVLDNVGPFPPVFSLSIQKHALERRDSAICHCCHAS